MFRFEFSSNLDLFFYHLLEKGIYIWEWRTCFLSAAHTETDLAAFTQAIEETVAELRGGDWLPALPADSAPLRVPLSEAQKQLWLLRQMEPQGSLAYQINTSVELLGEMDAERLCRAIQDVATRHEALRTTFASEHEQIVWPATRMDVPLTDFSALAPAEAERCLREWQRQDSNRAIDLVNGPVFRADLIKLAVNRHVLSLTAHHIVSDGGTMALLVSEIAAAYTSGKIPAPAALQFREYLAASAARRATDEMKPHREYWLAQFGDDPAPLQLPSDRPRPARNTYRGGRATWRIDADLAGDLRRFSRAEGCTLYVSLLSAFGVFLHRVTGQDDVTVGVPVSGRFRRESQSVAGYCTHLLPLRSRFEADESFAQCVARNRKALLGGMEHQEYPFAELLRELSGRGAAPLVSVVFNLEPVSQFPHIAGLALRPVDPEIHFSAFDLSVNVTDTGSELCIDCDYSGDLFERQTVLRFLETYETLLRAALADPGTKVSRMRLLSEGARERMAAMWNGPQAQGEHGLSALARFERHAVQDPGHIAIIDGTARLSYGELNARAANLAGRLVDLGIGRETRVAICAERRAHLITGLLAIWKAGGAYVPIDPEYPAARQEFMLEDSGAGVVLTDRACSGILPKSRARLVYLDAPGEPPRNIGPRMPEWHDLAYVIYTSGSTGRPKGVAVTHGGVAWLAQWARSFYSETQLRGVLFSTSVCFDVSVFEIFVPLACGGTVILAENVLQLPQLPAAGEVTLVSTVPSAIPELLRAGSWPASVATVQLAGERVLRNTVQRLYRQTPVLQVLNLYGPTEDTVYATGAAIERDDEQAPSIGRPLLNKRAYVLDRYLQPVPVSVVGDLYLGGPGLAREYLNRPELTQERFVPDPFVEGEKLYRTGDLARFREDGNIEFLGRSDHQIKLRGFRIELGEIETALTAHPHVKDAIVVLHESGGSPQLVAYVKSDRAEAEATAILRQHLQTRVPGHMAPSAFVVLSEFPVLPNGKIDRARLPEPGVGTLYTAPRDSSEERLAAIWQEAIGRPRIGILDNFFEAGGNSLSATRVAARIRETMCSDIEVRTIFAYPTIAGLAREIARRESAIYDPINPIPFEDTYAVSPVQRRFWVQEQTSSAGGSALPACFFIEGTLREELFDEAFRSLVARHEILRTVFPTDSDVPRQRVLSPAEVGFCVKKHDTSHAANPEADAVAIVRRISLEPMDLAHGPLLRVQLIRLSDAKHVCAVTMHHIVTDGWSIEVLLDEFLRTYDALAEGSPAELAPLGIQYKDYAAWLNRFLENERGAAMRDYWVQQLGGELQPLDFPTTTPRALARAYLRKTYRLHLSEDRARQVDILGRRHGASQFMVLLAALNVLLYRNTGNEDLIVGSPVAGRVRTELEGQIGPYLNVVALRTRVAGADRFDALVDQVREITLDAYANQLYPFDRVVEQLGITRVPGRNPVFDVGFTFQNQRSRSEDRSRNLHVEERTYPEMEATAAEALTDFWFVAEPAGAGLDVNLVYNGALFAEPIARRLAEDFQTILSCAADDSGIRLHSIPLDRG
ncbi:MAG: amino acid adenylation domain-containing protein, partial [Bryobacteraceae bacterium]